jgi:DNA-binding protein HU-beta
MSELDPDWEDFMNRRELVLALAERTETDRRTADEMVSSLVDLITDTVSSGEVVAISGFAKFARVDRAARMGRNPQTGEAIKIKASRKARITPLKGFKDAVLVGKRPAARKTTAKKAPAKKTTTRNTTARKAAPAKRGAVKKTAARKTTAKKTTAKKTTRRR